VATAYEGTQVKGNLSELDSEIDNLALLGFQMVEECNDA
jgi:hypothetical protein